MMRYTRYYMMQENARNRSIGSSGDEIVVGGFDSAVVYDPTPEDTNRDAITDQDIASLAQRLPAIYARIDAIDPVEQSRQIHELHATLIGSRATQAELKPDQ